MTNRFAFICLCFIISMFFLPVPESAQPAGWKTPPVLFPEPLSPRIANYDIFVKLDTAKNLLHGREVLTWKNNTPTAVNELQFHLYLNAFRNSKSTFMIETGRRHRGYDLEKSAWGFMEINRLALVSTAATDEARKLRWLHPESNPPPIPGTDVTGEMTYIHPDNPEHVHDKTVMQIRLPQPLPPGDSIEVYMDFTARLPEPPYARTGVMKEFYFVAQWFPKIGVYTDKGWNCHQYHNNSEFFADFGVYNVWINLPVNYIVGATGVRVGEAEKQDDGTESHFFHAEDVHDFAWTASPYFEEFKGRSQDVDIRVLMQPGHAEQGPRHVEAARVAVEFFQNRYGDYPYPNLTVVDSRRGAGETAGMEYPTLFTAGTWYGLPENIRLVELVIVHEFGHNYWYNMVATNEFEESWLDEGLTTYTEVQIMNDKYGPRGDLVNFLGIKLDAWHLQRLQYLSEPAADPMLRKAWEYYSSLSYTVNSYSRPTLLLRSLHNIVGEETMQRILRTYLEQWGFRHPRSQDFVNVVNEVAGQDFTSFFNQALYSEAVHDYAVDKVFTRPYVKKKGYDFTYTVDDDLELPPGKDTVSAGNVAATETLQAESPDSSDGKPLFYSGVNIRRLGDFKFPVEVEMVFEDGEAIREHWDGQALWKKFRYLKTTRLVSATVDPDNKLAMDVNFTNNSKAIESHSLGVNKLAMRWLFWVQFVFDQPEFLNLLTIPLGFN